MNSCTSVCRIWSSAEMGVALAASIARSMSYWVTSFSRTTAMPLESLLLMCAPAMPV